MLKATAIRIFSKFDSLLEEAKATAQDMERKVADCSALVEKTLDALLSELSDSDSRVTIVKEDKTRKVFFGDEHILNCTITIRTDSVVMKINREVACEINLAKNSIEDDKVVRGITDALAYHLEQEMNLYLKKVKAKL